MDTLFELMRRDAIDSARFLRWLGRLLGVLRIRACPRCHDNPLRACAACYENPMI
jgi:hypothetical protein